MGAAGAGSPRHIRTAARASRIGNRTHGRRSGRRTNRGTVRSRDAVSRRCAPAPIRRNAPPLLHPRCEDPRREVSQPRDPQVVGGTHRRRLGLPAERLHRQRHFAPVEPALLLRREDRRRDRGRQPRPAGLPPGAPARDELEVRGHHQGQAERPARKTQAQTRRRPVGLHHRQEHQAHQGLLGRKGIPQRRSGRAHRERLGPSAGRDRHLRDRQEGQGQDRQDQLPGQRTVHRQAAAPHLQENPPEVDQLPAQHQAQRIRLRRRQGAPHRFLQLPRLPQRHGRARFDLPHRLQAPGHRHRSLGRQQILHPQRLVGGQLGL